MAFVERASDALGAMPGIRGVATGLLRVLSGDNWGQHVSVEGFRKVPDTDDETSYNAVSPKYFEILGSPLIAGREFTASDNATAPKVAVVNEAFAKKFNLGRDAVGKRLSFDNDSLNIEIVGLVKDSKYSGVTSPIPPVAVVPYRQTGISSTTSFYVRTALPTVETVRAIRETMRGLDPKLPIEDLKTLPQQVRENVFLERMMSTTSAAFAMLATLLAAIGLYGVLAYSVTQRTREIGVRMALGAQRGKVYAMVLRQAGWLTLIGVGAGVACSIGASMAMKAVLFRVAAWDVPILVAVALVLGSASLVASFLPARRAALVNPVEALRAE
jgi:predicted permease